MSIALQRKYGRGWREVSVWDLLPEAIFLRHQECRKTAFAALLVPQKNSR